MSRFTFISALAVLAGSAAFAAEIPLVNPDFTEGTKGWSQNGRIPKDIKVTEAMSVVEDAAVGKALKLEDKWEDAQPYAIQFFKLAPNAKNRVTITFKAKAEKGHVFTVGCQFQEGGKYLGSNTKNFTGTGEWKEYTAVIGKVAANADRFTVALYVTPWDYKRTGTVYYTNIRASADLAE